MVNYSIVMRSNPMDADAAKKAYASAQYAEAVSYTHLDVYKRQVQSGSRYHTLVQCVGQVFLVHQGTAAGIYQNGRRFHKGQAGGIDHICQKEDC